MKLLAFLLSGCAWVHSNGKWSGNRIMAQIEDISVAISQNGSGPCSARGTHDLRMKLRRALRSLQTRNYSLFTVLFNSIFHSSNSLVASQSFDCDLYMDYIVYMRSLCFRVLLFWFPFACLSWSDVAGIVKVFTKPVSWLTTKQITFNDTESILQKLVFTFCPRLRVEGIIKSCNWSCNSRARIDLWKSLSSEVSAVLRKGWVEKRNWLAWN